MQSHSTVFQASATKKNNPPFRNNYGFISNLVEFPPRILINTRKFFSTRLFQLRIRDSLDSIFQNSRTIGSISEGTKKGFKIGEDRLFYDGHGRRIADSFVTFGEEFSQEGQEVAGVKRSSRIFAKRCLHYRLLPLSKRPSSRYYIVSKRICNRHLPSFLRATLPSLPDKMDLLRFPSSSSSPFPFFSN